MGGQPSSHRLCDLYAGMQQRQGGAQWRRYECGRGRRYDGSQPVMTCDSVMGADGMLARGARPLCRGCSAVSAARVRCASSRSQVRPIGAAARDGVVVACCFRPNRLPPPKRAGCCREVTPDRLTALTEANKVASATFLDHDARIREALRTVTASGWPTRPAMPPPRHSCESSPPPALKSRLTASLPRLVWIIATGLLPLMILAALFGLLLAGRGGGADQVRWFGTLARRDGGRAAPPGVRIEDVAGADERSPSFERSSSTSTTPGTRRWAPAHPRVSCCSALRAPAGRSSQRRPPVRPASRSSPSPARGSSSPSSV